MGWVEVIVGEMFSGKSERLMRRLSRAQKYAKRRVVAFNHANDTRYSRAANIGCHSGGVFPACAVRQAQEILPLAEGFEVVGIDEAQFFDEALVGVINTLANNGARVVVAGLDTDSEGKPFAPIPDIMAIAEKVEKVHAVCVGCGRDSCRSHYKGNKSTIVEVGYQQYEPLCRRCYKAKVSK